MRLTINSIKDWLLWTLCHSENEETQEPETIKPEIVLPRVDDEPLKDLEETEVFSVEGRGEGEGTKDAINTLPPESEEEYSDNVKFDVIESVTPLVMMPPQEVVNGEQETDKQENGNQDNIEQDTEGLVSEKAVKETKLVSLTVDSIKYYDKLRSQMPTDDLKSILDDVCRNLIDNLILSGCTPINEEPGCFDMTRHRVEPFQLVEEGTPYTKVLRKGIEYEKEVMLLAIVEL